jgi:glutaredoxin 3
MAKVEIYTTSTCPYCVAAKNLLKNKMVDYIEYSVDTDHELRTKMMDRAGGARSVPQIFINDEHIKGGSDGLHQLDKDGKLDPLLAKSENNGKNQNGPGPA